MKTSSTARNRAAAALAVAALGSAAALTLVGTAIASTEVVTAPLAAPQGLSPDDSGSALPHAVRKTVTLSWAAVPGASGYRVQVGTDGTWSDDAAISFTQDVDTTSVTLPVSLPHATYVWRVAALKGGALGHWSSEEGQAHSDAEFTRGWRATPTQNTVTFTGRRPVFSWSPVAYATGYEIEISSQPFPAAGPSTAAPDTTPNPSTQTQAPVVDTTCFTPRTRFAPFQAVAGAGSEGSLGKCDFAIPAAGTTLYWRVRPVDRWKGDAASGPTVRVSQSGVSYLPPTSDSNPPSNITTDCPVPASSASPSASASASATPTATPSTGSGEETGCSAAPEDAELGNWTPGSTFTWSPNASNATTLGTVPTDSLSQDPSGLCTVSTPDGTAEKGVCSDFPTISWNGAGTTYDRYRLYVALDDQFSNIQTIVETSAHEWTPATSWRESSPSLSYYYAVQGCNATACGPVTSTPPSFRKVTPRAVVTGTPATRGTLRLDWQSYAQALGTATGKATPEDAWYYHVQVATADHPSYDATVVDAGVDGYDAANEVTPASSDAVSYFPKGLGDGSFVWRVQAVDSAGDLLPWSKSQAFVRDVTPPRAVSTSPSAGIGVKSAVKVTFSEPVTGVSASTLTAIADGATAPVSVQVAADGRSATLVPSRPWVAGATYATRVSPSVQDVVGNAAVATGPSFTVTKTVDDASGGLAFGSGWTSLRSTNAHSGTFHRTATRGATLTTSFHGSTAVVYGCLGPNNGYATISVAGVSKKFSLYRSYSGCNVRVAVLTGLGGGTHSARLTVVGAHPSGSKGNNVDVDFLAVS